MSESLLNEWSNYPINLNYAEIADPFSVIADFFSADDVPGHLRELQEWRSCVLEQQFYTGNNGSPSGLLFTWKLHIKLIEVLYLLMQPQWSKAMMLTTRHVHLQLQKEKVSWSYYPVNANEQELLNPFLTLKQFFDSYSLHAYREQLYEWLEAALSLSGINEILTPADLINVYENLQKSYGAAWLIHQRISNKTYLKLEKEQAQILPTLLVPTKPLLYKLDQEIDPVNPDVMTKLVSKIKHKLTTVQTIFYLGRTAGTNGAMYFFITTDHSEQRQAQSISAMLEESCLPIARIVALVHYGSFLLNAAEGNNRFIKKVLNSTIIYLSGDTLLPKLQPVSSGSADSNWQHWHGQGKDFLDGAVYYLQKGATIAALFSLHQCAECLLIAVISAVLGYRVNTHNLKALLKITRIFTNEFTRVLDPEDKENKVLFKLLRDAYVNIRYIDNFETDDQAVSTLLLMVRTLAEKAESVYTAYMVSNNL